MKSRIRLVALISFIFLTLLVLNTSAQAGTSHGVNGYVSDCGTGYNVTGANVIFQLFNSNGTLKTQHTLSAIVASDGWYYVDVGNFDKPWIRGDIVLINISKNSYYAMTSVNLTEAGNDQAFTVCLGPGPWNWSCACGNRVCEWWPPLCENNEFNITVGNKIITTKRCPEDCADCICGNDRCQPECGENVSNSAAYCPADCPPGFCGDGLINSPLEQCDGADWGMVKGCESFGLNGGILSCKNCSFDTSQCEGVPGYCGDETINPGEQCDGANMGKITCELLGFGAGSLTCKECKLDTSGCGPFVVFAQCGDGKCTGAENRENCCLDCGCPEPIGCKHFKCINNRCKPTCGLFGYYCVWLGLCWYLWVAIAIAVIIALIIYILTRWNLKKIVAKLDSLTKSKMLVFTEKTKIYEKWH